MVCFRTPSKRTPSKSRLEAHLRLKLAIPCLKQRPVLQDHCSLSQDYFKQIITSDETSGFFITLRQNVSTLVQ